MKRLMLVAALVALVACATKDDTKNTDTINVKASGDSLPRVCVIDTTRNPADTVCH